MFSRSDLSRADREMMAVITSISNNCCYCQVHHSQALNQYWKNDAKIEKLYQNFNDASLAMIRIYFMQVYTTTYHKT